MEESCRAEVAELHAFFEAWFAGRLPDEDAAFARFTGVMAPELERIAPDGTCTPRDELVGRLRAAHGSTRETGTRVWTEKERARPIDSSPESAWLVTYEEWQDDGSGPRGRISTAVLRRADGTPNGLVWVRVHETWLP